MKPVYFFLANIFFLIIINSSFVCKRFSKSVSVDSLHFFTPGQIYLAADDFRNDTFQLNLHNGVYIFSKDADFDKHLFKSDKDANNFYLIVYMITNKINSTSLITKMGYQSFDRKKRTNSSKVYELKNVPIPLSNLKSFTVTAYDYKKVFQIIKSTQK
ncbi:MAG TPA: hypothetical protein VFQ58_04205 [Flavisolibacter sp.]|nr:hypothetical protein [Flavisolibacter sp.]